MTINNLYYRYRFSSGYNDNFIIYKDSRPYMRAVRKNGWLFNTRVQLFIEDGNLLVLEYRYFEFFYTKINVIFQDLPKTIKLRRKNLFSYIMQVDNRVIYNKFKNNFSNQFGEVYIDNEKVAHIRRKLLTLQNDIQLGFLKHSEYEQYCVILLLMDITAIDNS